MLTVLNRAEEAKDYIMALQFINQHVTSKVSQFTLIDIYRLHKDGKLFYDREKLQRLLIAFSDYKMASFLSTLMQGANFKDLFQLAEISPIVDHLTEKLKNPDEDTNPQFVQENLDYFRELKKNGHEYLVLDGQHRIDTVVKYFDGAFDFQPLKNSRPIVAQDPKEVGKVYIRGLFTKLPKSARELIGDIKVLVTVYTTGDLRELVNVFISSNENMPMTNHEKRILNYNSLNRWIVDLCKKDENLNDLFTLLKGMTGEYSLDHKGDTLIVAEMLRYLDDNVYEGYKESDMNDMLGHSPTISPSSDDKRLLTSIIRIIGDGAVSIPEADLKKFGRSSFYNIFYTLSFLMQSGNEWSRTKIGKKYDIIDSAKFVQWFFDKEHERVFNPDSNIILKGKVNGKTKEKKQVHDYSFKAHNADQNHSRKESFKGDGGSKYDFDNWARVRYLLADLIEDIDYLEKRGIIREAGSRRGDITRDEKLVDSGVKLSESHDKDIDEVIPFKFGGKRNRNNTRIVESSINRSGQARPKRIKSKSVACKKPTKK
jgi:hypothetical protein